MKTRVVLACFGLVVAAGCHDSTGPTPGGPLSGHWKGTPSVYVPLDFTLTQTDSLLQGSGTAAASVSQPMDVIGFVSSASATPVAMSFAVENVTPAFFLGTLSADGRIVSGRFYAFGGGSDTMSFIRQ